MLRRIHLQGKIFSTYVEVFLCLSPKREGEENFLHVCGGVSQGKRILVIFDEFSPRMWRCFLESNRQPLCCYIFSTYVEVFLISDVLAKRTRYFLHVCGGVSMITGKLRSTDPFSPRMWRCFSSE